MNDQMQNIVANNHGFFHILLNSWDDDLNPHQYRLLGHYARVAGQEGGCWEGLRATAKKCQMSHTTVIKVRRELEEMGLIRVSYPEEDDYESTITIEVVYDWGANLARYAGPKELRDPNIHPVTGRPLRGVTDLDHPVTDLDHPRSKTVTKEEPRSITKEEEKNGSSATSADEAGGAARRNPYLNTPAMYRDTQDRSGEVEVLEGEKPKIDPTAFELHVLKKVKSTARGISEFAHADFSKPLVYSDKNGDRQESPSINDLWDQEPSFREFVMTEVERELENRNMLNVTGYRKWLTSHKVIAHYYEWADKKGYLVGSEPEPGFDPDNIPNDPTNRL